MSLVRTISPLRAGGMRASRLSFPLSNRATTHCQEVFSAPPPWFRVCRTRNCLQGIALPVTCPKNRQPRIFLPVIRLCTLFCKNVPSDLPFSPTSPTGSTVGSKPALCDALRLMGPKNGCCTASGAVCPRYTELERSRLNQGGRDRENRDETGRIWSWRRAGPYGGWAGSRKRPPRRTMCLGLAPE